MDSLGILLRLGAISLIKNNLAQDKSENVCRTITGRRQIDQKYSPTIAGDICRKAYRIHIQVKSKQKTVAESSRGVAKASGNYGQLHKDGHGLISLVDLRKESSFLGPLGERQNVVSVIRSNFPLRVTYYRLISFDRFRWRPKCMSYGAETMTASGMAKPH